MGKIIAFPGTEPEKFGFMPARKKRASHQVKPGQLNLFSGGKVVSLHKLSPFEEALLLDEQHDAGSKKMYLKAIDQQESVADAYCNLGILESEEKNFPQAIDYFTKGLKADPRHYESHYNLANLYAEVGNLSLAKLHYELAIAIEPDFPNSYFNLALTLAMRKEIAESIQQLVNYKKLVSASDQAHADELISNLSESQ
jgi:tetratricopeptide (TPR) repeat protein